MKMTHCLEFVLRSPPPIFGLLIYQLSNPPGVAVKILRENFMRQNFNRKILLANFDCKHFEAKHLVGKSLQQKTLNTTGLVG